MAYKKYIKRGEKTYGPYIYHSRRADGKVISEYHGTKKTSHKKIFLTIIGVLVLAAIIYATINLGRNITGKSIIDIDADYSEGIISGKLTLSPPEEIPESAKLIFENNGQIISEQNLKKFLYPDVYFNLLISTDPLKDSPQETNNPGDTEEPIDSVVPIPEDNSTTQEEINSTNEENTLDSENEQDNSPNNETTSEKPLTEETPPQEKDSQKTENSDQNKEEKTKESAPEESNIKEETPEDKSNKEDKNQDSANEKSEKGQDNIEDSNEESSTTPLTGSVISEGIKIIEGKISKGEIFTYKLKNKETFKGIDQGSVRTEIEKIEDSSIQTSLESGEIIVATDYSTNQVIIDLSEFNLTLEPGIMKVSIVDETGSELASATINTSSMETINSLQEELNLSEVNETELQYINLLTELTDEEKQILISEFGNNAIKTERAIEKNGFIIVTYALGNYNVEFSYSSKMKNETLEDFAERDRAKWLKDVARNLLKKNIPGKKIETFNESYPIN
ncbi:MAG: hypothetical protein Q8P81_00710 [Nanoarchaeota archaeon]|nr:hypothetical protein [Nanoarchaeota archaeon]